MKIIFVTNIVIFHQTGIWDSFYNQLNDKDEFIYLATSFISNERKKMGYEEDVRPYVVKSKDLDENDLKKLFSNVDVVIVGSIEDKRVKKYLWKAKYYITASEHIRKKNNLRSLLSLMKHMFKLFIHKGYKNKYLIGYSSKIGREYASFGFPKNHIFKFGYFPSLPIVSKQDIKNKDHYQLCFCARLLDLKRPMFAIKILEEFLKYDSRYKLTMIGEGPEQEKILDYIKENNLENNFNLIPFQSHDEVLNIMKKSTYYLFTSTKEEGWGVVLNEALSQGTIPISSTYAGSSFFLIKNRINGYLYSKDIEVAYIIKKCIDTKKEELFKMHIEAANTIKNLWNYIIAGERLYELCYSIVNKKEFNGYKEGPISRG